MCFCQSVKTYIAFVTGPALAIFHDLIDSNVRVWLVLMKKWLVGVMVREAPLSHFQQLDLLNLLTWKMEVKLFDLKAGTSVREASGHLAHSAKRFGPPWLNTVFGDELFIQYYKNMPRNQNQAIITWSKDVRAVELAFSHVFFFTVVCASRAPHTWPH